MPDEAACPDTENVTGESAGGNGCESSVAYEVAIVDEGETIGEFGTVVPFRAVRRIDDVRQSNTPAGSISRTCIR